MKNKLIIQIITTLSILCSALFLVGQEQSLKYIEVNPPVIIHRDSSILSKLPIKLLSKTKIKSPTHSYTGNLHAFLHKMGHFEGLGSYSTVNKFGYLGMYQFSPHTLNILGFHVTKEEFLNNPDLQDSAMVAFMKDNAESLRGIINEYSGKMYDGVYITKSGILAGAHLVGPGGVLAFFYPDKYKFRTVDGNGTSVKEYISKFAGYDLRGI